eukprot:13212376-Alexandrium_andersonii.AAC.1
MANPPSYPHDTHPDDQTPDPPPVPGDDRGAGKHRERGRDAGRRCAHEEGKMRGVEWGGCLPACGGVG